MDADGEKVEVKFVTKLTQYKITEKPFHLPVNVTRAHLSKTINYLLGAGNQVSFDFLIDNEFLRSTLDAFLKKKNRSKEETITIEYVEALTPPEPSDTNQHPDWIGAIDNHLALLNAARLASKSSLVVPYGAYDNKVWLLTRSEEASEPVSIGEHKQAVTSVSSRIDIGGNITLVSGSLDQSVKVWSVDLDDPKSAVAVASLEGHDAGVQAVEVSPNGDLVCSGGWDNFTKIWALRPVTDDEDAEEATSKSKKHKSKKQKGKDSTETSTLPTEPAVNLAGHAGCVASLCWVSNEMVATGSWDHSIHLWDIGSGVSTRQLNGNKAFLSLKYNVNSKLLVSGLADKTIRVWDPRLGAGDASAFENQTYTSHSGWVSAVAWHPTNNNFFLSAGYDGSIKIWDLRSRTPLHSLTVEEDGDKLLDLQWFDEKTFVTAGLTGKLRFFADHATKSL